MAGPNTQAYFGAAALTKEKSFYDTGSSCSTWRTWSSRPSGNTSSAGRSTVRSTPLS